MRDTQLSAANLAEREESLSIESRHPESQEGTGKRVRRAFLVAAQYTRRALQKKEGGRDALLAGENRYPPLVTGILSTKSKKC